VPAALAPGRLCLAESRGREYLPQPSAMGLAGGGGGLATVVEFAESYLASLIRALNWPEKQ